MANKINQNIQQINSKLFLLVQMTSKTTLPWSILEKLIPKNLFPTSIYTIKSASHPSVSTPFDTFDGHVQYRLQTPKVSWWKNPKLKSTSAWTWTDIMEIETIGANPLIWRIKDIKQFFASFSQTFFSFLFFQVFDFYGKFLFFEKTSFFFFKLFFIFLKLFFIF